MSSYCAGSSNVPPADKSQFDLSYEDIIDKIGYSELTVPREPGKTGLRNPQNNCFINVILQTIFANEIRKDFDGKTENSSINFVYYLINKLGEDTNRGVLEIMSNTFDKKSLPNFDEETIIEAGSDFLSQQRTYSSSIVTDLFTITSCSIINCNGCAQKTIAFQQQVHIGESFSSGHFISKLKNLVTEDWQLFDDARIRMLDPDDVKVALKLSLHWLIIDSHICTAAESKNARFPKLVLYVLRVISKKDEYWSKTQYQHLVC
uniref:USP domain-containing protein n=1 Tax=Meloidogyne floridensis TaxID=298350 RepID=A0A915P5A8_9BILA